MERQRGRVWIVDDNEQFLRVAEQLLEGLDVEIRCFELGHAFLAAFTPGAPECLLLDVRLPDIEWRALLEGVRMRDPLVPLVLVTGTPEVEIAVDALKEGVHDYLVKPVDRERLRKVVMGALEKSWIEDGAHRERTEARRKLERLTPREREVLELLVEGLASKVIATRLGCSKKTIDVHRSAILRKFDVDNVVDVVKLRMSADAEPTWKGSGAQH